MKPLQGIPKKQQAQIKAILCDIHSNSTEKAKKIHAIWPNYIGIAWAWDIVKEFQN